MTHQVVCKTKTSRKAPLVSSIFFMDKSRQCDSFLFFQLNIMSGSDITDAKAATFTS